MTPKQFLKRINKAIQNEQLDFYTEEDPDTFEPKPLTLPYTPTTINETIVCIMNEWAENWLYAWGVYFDTPYFRTEHSDSNIKDVFEDKLEVTGMYMDIKCDHDTVICAEIEFPEYDEDEKQPEQYIQSLIAGFLLTISKITEDFNAEETFREYFNASRRDVSPRDLLDALEADEEQFSEISKAAYNEYKKYRL